MNVLLITPDAVGSTLLQRLITVYMQFHQFDQPVINIHELTNGLIKYYSQDFNRELLGKPSDENAWGYHQSLDTIVKMLSSVEHFKTSRLARYHIIRRQDSLSDQIPFYRYLDDNFFIISCRRRNVFEHALSWGLNKITKKLNVYSGQEKLNAFIELYKRPFDIDVESFLTALKEYGEYISWADNNFSIASYFYYEDHIGDLEKYILNLPIFAGQPQRIGWHDKFDLDFADYNRYRFFASDIGTLALDRDRSTSLLSLDDQSQSESDVMPLLPRGHLHFMIKHKANFINADVTIGRMVELGIMITPLPIKKTTLAEKMYLIRNLDACLEVYNRWAEHNLTICRPLTRHELEQSADQEKKQWLGIPKDQDQARADPRRFGSY